MARFAALIAYDGACFYGWQVQPNANTVQAEMEKAMADIAKQPVKVYGSGRTDAGVHALGQLAHFDWPLNMNGEQIKKALHTKLPEAIRIIQVHAVNAEFSARYDATNRTYEYIICKERTPFNRNYASYYPRIKIDTQRLNNCFEYFLGEHDFSAFCRLNPKLKHHRCMLNKLVVIEETDKWVVTISANRFLHNMVRRIVGTSLHLMHKNYDFLLIKQLLLEKKADPRYIATAPPQGLYLKKVNYAAKLSQGE